jgi:hypothetical protein
MGTRGRGSLATPRGSAEASAQALRLSAPLAPTAKPVFGEPIALLALKLPVEY